MSGEAEPPHASLAAISERVQALAKLTVNLGANVAPGQIVVLNAKLGQQELARAVAAACYEAGAHQVEVHYADPYVQRARLKFAPDEALGTVTPWLRRRPGELAELRGALIGLSGPSAPGLLDDVDPARIGRDTIALPEWAQVIDAAAVNWTIVPGPTAAWAKLVFPDLDEATAYERLWEQIARVCRLDEADPIAAWWTRVDELAANAARLDAAKLDSLHFIGPGTDLTVGLIPRVSWTGGGFETVYGRRHIPNVPTEEVFTTPDPEQTEGVVSSTRPLLVSGRSVNGLRVRFEAGRAVQIDADEGAGLVRELVTRDADANRLGEVALVDGSGRVGPTGTVFHDTLLDENAASHIALGSGFAHLAADEAAAEHVNVSGVHTDFMIGGPEVRVTATTSDGRELPILVDDRWALE
jgi:aminopeptidase